jgi:hypothetical protein
VLLLASALSLAFPIENPAFNRTGVTIPVVYIIAALTPGLFWGLVRGVLPSWRGALVAGALLAVLLGFAAVQNFSFYFREYAQGYRVAAPNSAEIAARAAAYGDGLGGRDRVFLVLYPHWVDARAVGMHMGDISWSNVVPVESLGQQAAVPGPKVYLLHEADARGRDELRRVYPDGLLMRQRSSMEGKDFYVYVVNR